MPRVSLYTKMVLPPDFELPGPSLGTATNSSSRAGSRSRFRPFRFLIGFASKLVVVTTLGGLAAWYLGGRNGVVIEGVWRALRLVAG